MGRLLRLRRKDKGQRGQAMVEFALILPLLLIITFIIVDFGFGFSQWVIITNATREGARLGATGVAADQVEARTMETSNGRLTSPDEIDVEYMDRDLDGEIGRGDRVVVKATYNYNLLTPLSAFLNLTGFSPIPLSACSDMRLEIKVPSAIGGGSGC